MNVLIGIFLGLIVAPLGEALVAVFFLKGPSILHRHTPVLRLSLNVLVMILAYAISLPTLLGATLTILAVRALAILWIWHKGGE